MTKVHRRLWLWLGVLVLAGCATDRTPRPAPQKTELPPLLSGPPAAPTPARPERPAPAPLLPLKTPVEKGGLDAMVSISLVDGGLKELLHALVKQAGVNVIIDPDVEDAKVSLNLQHIPLWQALDAVLTSHGLFFSSHPGYVRVSKMMTRVFHLDYVMSVRSGSSTTQVSLSSGTSAATTGTSPGSSLAVSGSSTAGPTSPGQLSTSSSTGDISIQTQETVDFWKQLETRLRELMRDPRYQMLRAEFQQQDLRRQMELLPYETQYDKELLKHQLEMFQLEREVVRKKLETGLWEGQTIPGGSAAAQARTTKEGSTRATEATSSDTSQAPLVGTYALDPQTGTLIVTTSPAVMERVERFLAQVKDNLVRQVHIDVQILEVSLNNDQQLGVDWNGFPGLLQLFRMPRLREVIRGQMESQATGGGGGGGTSTSGTGVVSPLPVSPFTPSPLSAFQMGLLFAPTAELGIQYTLNNVISFLRTQGDVKAVSRPQITTLNNQPAVISVGVNDFFVTFEQITTAAASGGIATSQVTSRVNPLFIGVTLHITPQISPQGEILLKIVPAVNQRVGEKLVPTGIPSAPTQAIPLLETRQTSTVVRLLDGQTLLISGLIQEREQEISKSVPYLAEVPVMGSLFRHTTKEKRRSELILLLTPRLVEINQPVQETGVWGLERGS